MNKTDRRTYNVILRCVHETMILRGSNKYYILACVCVLARACMCLPGRVVVCMRIRAYSLAYPARKEKAPCCDVICGPSGSTIFFDIIS